MKRTCEGCGQYKDVTEDWKESCGQVDSTIDTSKDGEPREALWCSEGCFQKMRKTRREICCACDINLDRELHAYQAAP